MNDKFELVEEYYRKHFSELSDKAKYHFASRMLAWYGGEDDKNNLKKLYGYVVGDNPEQSLRDLLVDPPKGNRSLINLRQPFFEKYPMILFLDQALTKIRNAKYIYGEDISGALFGIVGKADLKTMLDRLLDDAEAMKYLSTIGITVSYLAARLLYGSTEIIDLQKMRQIGQSYDLDDALQVRLLLYLYTHCVIYESNIYTENIDAAKKKVFMEMMADLDVVIDEHFEDISLDNKLEFLVCARMCNYSPKITDKIYAECDDSMKAPDEMFLVDTKNKNAGSTSISLDGSEHRNVLFLLGRSAYSPHSTLVRD